MASVSGSKGLDPAREDSLVGTIIQVNAGFIAAIALIITIRLAVRLRILNRIWCDDVLMLFAGIFTVALCAMCTVGTRFGLGQHELDLMAKDRSGVLESTEDLVKVLLVCQLLYVTAITITKASIIASYLRVLPTPTFRWLMYVTGTVVIAIWICSVFVTTFQCTPTYAAWDLLVQKKKCVNIVNFFYVQSSINIATDLLLCTSPLPLFWKLNVARNERILLCTVFGFGLFATAASAVRMSLLHNLGSKDISYDSVSSLNWSVVEVGTGIICACVPSLKPIIIRLFPGKFFTAPRVSTGRSQRPRQSNPSEAKHDGYDVEMRSAFRGIAATLRTGSERKTPLGEEWVGRRNSDDESLVRGHYNIRRTQSKALPPLPACQEVEPGTPLTTLPEKRLGFCGVVAYDLDFS